MFYYFETEAYETMCRRNIFYFHVVCGKLFFTLAWDKSSHVTENVDSSEDNEICQISAKKYEYIGIGLTGCGGAGRLTASLPTL